MSRLTVIRRRNIEAENRGWEVDSIVLLVDGVPAGRACIENIPQANIDTYYMNGVYDYLRHIRGRKMPDDIMLLSREDAYRYECFKVPQNFDSLNYKQRMKCILPGMVQAYQDFIAFHVDRPFFTYVRTYSKHDKHKNYGDPSIKDYIWFTDRKSGKKTNPDFTKIGLGKVLYFETARFLAERNLVLHASNIQTEEAKNMWNKLRLIPGLVSQREFIQNNEYSHELYDDISINPQYIPDDYFPDWVTDVEYKEGSYDIKQKSMEYNI